MFAECDITIDRCDCITPFGDGSATWRALCEGRSNLRMEPLLGHGDGDTVPISLFGHMEPVTPPRWMRHVRQTLAPVTGAEWGRSKTPIFISSSNFGVDSLFYYRHEQRLEQLPYAVPHDSVEQIRRELGWSRNISLFSHACVSAHIAILAASAALEAGAEKALVASYDFISPFVAGGFHSLKILNGALPRPFHAGETGSIALGEGAGYLILKKGGRGLRIRSQSTWNEMHHFTANNPDGSGFENVVGPMMPMLSGRKLWIKGHGTGTLDAGRLEATSLERLFPQAPLTGWKGSIGHTLGSCGIVELAIAARAMEEGRVPGTVGSGAPFFAGNVVAETFDAASCDTALILSNAFGGAHAALALCHD